MFLRHQKTFIYLESLTQNHRILSQEETPWSPPYPTLTTDNRGWEYESRTPYTWKKKYVSVPSRPLFPVLFCVDRYPNGKTIIDSPPFLRVVLSHTGSMSWISFVTIKSLILSWIYLEIITRYCLSSKRMWLYSCWM